MNKKLIFILLPIIIGSFFYLGRRPQKSSELDNPSISKKADHKAEVAPIKEDPKCLESFTFYEQKISALPLSLRFKNSHLKIEDKIYRLRFFYDDGDEGEVATYQVFLEDEQEYADLIETTKLSPGPKYQEILQKNFELLYDESGLLNKESDEFIHVENKKILKVISNKAECVRD